MNSLSGQSLLQHITEADVNAVSALLTNGIVNLDERDEVTLTILCTFYPRNDVSVCVSLSQVFY